MDAFELEQTQGGSKALEDAQAAKQEKVAALVTK